MKETSVFKNIIYNFILMVFNIIIPVITSGYIVRTLSVETYSTYNVLINDLQIFKILGAMGIATYGVRQMGLVNNSKKDKNKLFSELFIINLFSSLVIFGLAVVSSFRMGENQIFFLIMTLQLLAEIFNLDWIKTAKEDFKFIVIKTMTIRSLYIVYLFNVVKKPDDLLLYTIGTISTNILDMTLSSFFIKKDVKLVFKELELKKHINPLIILAMSSNISILYATLDKKFLELFVSDEAVTYYAMAVLLINMITSLSYPIVQSSIPRLSKLIKDNHQGYINLLKITFDSYLFLSVPLLIGCIVMAKDIIVLFATEVYSPAINPTIIYSVFKLFAILISFFATTIMYLYKKEKITFKVNLFIGIMNFTGNCFLVVFNVLTIETTLILSVILEIIMVIIMYSYVRKNLIPDINLINKRHLEILIISLFFIPISLFIRSFELSIYINVFSIPLICIIMYFGYFTLRKSEFMMIYYEKINQILKIKK